MNRRERRGEAKQLRREGGLDQQRFLAVAGQFIDQANRLNRTVVAADVALALQYAAARYSAHLARNVLAVADHEAFVEDVLKQQAEMLRQNLADPDL